MRQKIQPWFLPTSYRFLPHPLNYLLASSIPFVLPAIPLIVGAFAFHKVASSVRIKRYLRHSKLDTCDGAAPGDESEGVDLDECLQRTTAGLQ